MTDQLQNSKKKYDDLDIIKFEDFSLGFFDTDKKTFISILNEHALKEFKIRSEQIEYSLPRVTFITDIQVKAIEANTNAKNAVAAYLKISSDKEAEQFSKLIEQHEQQIQERSWETYP